MLEGAGQELGSLFDICIKQERSFSIIHLSSELKDIDNFVIFAVGIHQD